MVRELIDLWMIGCYVAGRVVARFVGCFERRTVLTVLTDYAEEAGEEVTFQSCGLKLPSSILGRVTGYHARKLS
jgi:hypothetical protein